MTQDIDRHAADRNKVAIRWENERGDKRTLTYHELKAHSDALARGLLQAGEPGGSGDDPSAAGSRGLYRVYGRFEGGSGGAPLFGDADALGYPLPDGACGSGGGDCGRDAHRTGG